MFKFEYKDSANNMPYASTIAVKIDDKLNEPCVDKMGHLKVLRSL